jgi:uncharacterized protein YbjT (DUF2867 family)
MGKVLVTGALGNVGGQVARRLAEKGEAVVVADTHPEALSSRFGSLAQAVHFDYTDEATFGAALSGVDRVFIMRPPQLGKPEDLLPFITALSRQGGVRIACFLSLMGVEHNPMPPHHKIEKFIERAGLPFCHIRPSFFMQNLSGVHAFEIQRFGRIAVPAGHALTSFVDARDVGDLCAAALLEPEKHRGHCYDVTGPEALGYLDVAEIMSEELGRTVVYADPKPLFAQRYWTQIRGLDREYASVMSMLYLMTRVGAAKRVSPMFREVMGTEPRSFRQFVREYRSAWMTGDA